MVRERTNFVAVNSTILASLPKPARIGVESVICVSLSLRAQVNGDTCGVLGSHFVPPSSMLPVLSALKVIELSVRQA